MMMTGKSFNKEQLVFVGNTDKTIGRKYKKALFIEYQGPAFKRKKRRPSDATRGFVGPILRAEVGDTIIVHFKNKASRPYSMHPHGVFYDKASEGAMTLDGGSRADKAGNAIAPGKTYTYIWGVPERAGPGPNDPSSVAWLYHSHVNAVKDVYTGLVGGMIVTRQGMARKDGTPFDVDKEFVSLYLVSDENKSWYLNDNIKRFTKLDEAPEDDDDFDESNLMHGINGYVYGNMPTPVMYKDDRVRFYMMGMGTEVDLHTPHWHGNTVLWNGRRVDVVPLLPAQSYPVDMVADNPGTWMMHCHVDDHISAGMTARYTVLPVSRKQAKLNPVGFKRKLALWRGGNGYIEGDAIEGSSHQLSAASASAFNIKPLLVKTNLFSATKPLGRKAKRRQQTSRPSASAQMIPVRRRLRSISRKSLRLIAPPQKNIARPRLKKKTAA
ncbi:MAG: multicopper oxidase domain-containing protein, partial [Hyphomicrobiaceae bacterium]|nr:multicopper oxidase domain-containing protein [Hyphomicrobiaceae bacterium]